MTTEEAIARLHIDPDFICIKRFDYSLDVLLRRFPEGAPDKTIALALMITPEDVDRLYNLIIEKLKAAMNADL